MSIYNKYVPGVTGYAAGPWVGATSNEYVPSKKKPFKTVTVEYFEEFEKDTSNISLRRIRIVTTKRQYNLGKNNPVPVVTVNYEYM
jgi:hypothetical protein